MVSRNNPDTGLFDHQPDELMVLLRELVDKTLSDPQVLKDVAAVSVEHENGFLKIVLREREADSPGCRLHYWPAGGGDSKAHSHRWHMLAAILDGGYESQSYKPAETGEEFEAYEFTPENNIHTSLRHTGKAAFQVSPTHTYKKNDFYRISRGDVHKITRVLGGGALTAVFTWGENNKSAQVFSEGPMAKTENVQRSLSTEEVREYLTRADAHMNSFEANARD